MRSKIRYEATEIQPSVARSDLRLTGTEGTEVTEKKSPCSSVFPVVNQKSTNQKLKILSCLQVLLITLSSKRPEQQLTENDRM
jgi:hypothetical protein